MPTTKIDLETQAAEGTTDYKLITDAERIAWDAAAVAAVAEATTTELGVVMVPADGGLLINTEGEGEGEITLGAAEAAQLGGVMIPANGGLVNTDGSLVVAAASVDYLGSVTIAAVGTSHITNTAGAISIPIATNVALGVVKEGIGNVISGGGELNIDAAAVGTRGIVYFPRTEVFIGNGVLTEFELAELPSASCAVYLSGLRQSEKVIDPAAANDYEIVSKKITFVAAPVDGAHIIVDYIMATPA